MRFAFLAAASAAALALAAQPGSTADAPPSAQIAPAHYGSFGLDLTTEDHSVPPGDDFYRYAEGGWLAHAVIPADQTSTGVGYAVRNRAQAELRELIEDAARDPKTPTAAQIGALYKAFMDEARVEALDDKPLQPDLAAVAAIADHDAFTALMGRTNAGFGKSVVGIGLMPDPAKPEMNTLEVGQAGLGLPDRDYYLKDAFSRRRPPTRPMSQQLFSHGRLARPDGLGRRGREPSRPSIAEVELGRGPSGATSTRPTTR